MNAYKLGRRIVSHYASQNLRIEITDHELVCGGERVIFNVKLKKGAKESLFTDRASDIRTAMGIELFQPFKDGIELRLAVSLNPVLNNSLFEMLRNPIFRSNQMHIPIALGYSLMGNMIFTDLAKFPHCLYGGSTQSGKSVGLKCLIMSVAAWQPVSKVNLIIIDTGASDLDVFKTLPHLSVPIIKTEEETLRVLTALSAEMETRCNLPIADIRAMPAIICLIDEFNALIKNAGKDVRNSLADIIQDLLRRGIHSKIHVVLATQESAKGDMCIGLNNVNTRMAFACQDIYNSRSILGSVGAEKLPGRGAMLLRLQSLSEPMYIQGAFMSPEDICEHVNYIASHKHDSSNKFLITDSSLPEYSIRMEDDPVCVDTKPIVKDELAQIIMWALGYETISAEMIKKRFRKGNRAYDILLKLTQFGLISEKNSNQPRVVLPKSVDDISTETLAFLERNGYSADDVSTAIMSRFADDIQ